MEYKISPKLQSQLPDEIIHHIEQLERVRRDFVANVSHELRTPLTVVRGYLETLLTQTHDDTQPWKKIFSQMHEHSLRMEHLIEDLLLLSRLECTDHEIDHQNVTAVEKILSSICREANDLSGEKKHVITLHADTSLLLIGNEDELKSLFSNIIVNAVKYTPAQGQIDVRWYYKKNQAYFSVSDTGIGIAKHHIPRITERFYRIDKARSRESGGTGLGLAIAKHVLLRHDATMHISSKIGKGSTFTCLFPANRTKIEEINS